MRKYLQDHMSNYEKELNVDLMDKTFDKPLIEYIVDCWKSLEVVQNIKFVSYDYTEKESEIDVNKFIYKRDKRTKKKDKCDYKYINDTRVGKMTAHMVVSLVEKGEDGKPFIHEYPIKKEILIPLQDDEGYYFIKGKKYYMIYQLLEKSTYTSSAAVTLKSLMPIAVNRDVEEAHSVGGHLVGDEEMSTTSVDASSSEGVNYKLPVYNLYVFNKPVPAILFYLSRGIDYTLDFLNMNEVIDFIPDVPDKLDSKYIYFQLSSKCTLRVVRVLFEKFTFVQSVVGGFVHVSSNRLSMNQLDDRRTWIKKISNISNYDKGCEILKLFKRMLDESTKNVLKIHRYHVEDMYSLLRWIMQEYNDLRLKDNLSLDNKRLRCNEQIASLLTKEFSSRVYRIIKMGDKATIDDYRDLFKFPGNIILSKMHSSGIN